MSLTKQGVRVLLSRREAGGDGTFLFGCGSGMLFRSFSVYGRGGLGCTRVQVQSHLAIPNFALPDPPLSWNSELFCTKAQLVVQDNLPSQTDSLDFGHLGQRGATALRYGQGFEMSKLFTLPSTIYYHRLNYFYSRR